MENRPPDYQIFLLTIKEQLLRTQKQEKLGIRLTGFTQVNIVTKRSD
jgi:hypothetical protein